MSGSNPFRRSTAAPVERDIIPPPEPAITINQDTTDSINATQIPKDSSITSSNRQKTVRIASPPVPSSPTDPNASAATFTFANTQHEIPYGKTSFPVSPENSGQPDPFSQSLTADDSSDEDSDRHADPDPIPREAAPTRGTAAAQDKPPVKTVVNMPVFGLGHSQPEPTASISRRGTLDVDAFTRMLLTGNSEHKPDNGPSNKPATSSQVANLQQGASDSSSSSNVDAISFFQQTGDSHGAASADTPRTSHELSISEADDIRASYQTTKPPGEKKLKPPPPKTRRGKSIKSDAPPNPSLSSSAPPTQLPDLPTPYTEYTPTLGPLAERTSPPLPTAASLSLSEDVEGREASLSRTISQSKKPPTPPLARRHSQMKPSTTNKDRSKRISLPPSSSSGPLAGPSSPGLRTPPPPPTRRQDRISITSQSELASQSRSPLSQDSYSVSVDTPAATSSPSRSPSIRSSKQGPPSTPGFIAPPPPPPPRRFRASSKSSTGSNQHPASSHYEKGEENEEDEALPLPSNAQDILADLSRLQKEVDDLRGQYVRKVSG